MTEQLSPLSELAKKFGVSTEWLTQCNSDGLLLVVGGGAFEADVEKLLKETVDALRQSYKEQNEKRIASLGAGAKVRDRQERLAKAGQSMLGNNR